MRCDPFAHFLACLFLHLVILPGTDCTGTGLEGKTERRLIRVGIAKGKSISFVQRYCKQCNLFEIAHDVTLYGTMLRIQQPCPLGNLHALCWRLLAGPACGRWRPPPPLRATARAVRELRGFNCLLGQTNINMEGTMKKCCLPVLALFLIFLATAVLAVSPDANSAGAQAPSSGHGQFGCGDLRGGPGSGFRGGHGISSYLGLTQEQKDKMRELRNHYDTDTHDLRYDIRLKRLEFQKLFTDPKVDDATLLAKEKELSALRVKLMDRKAEMKIAWRRILTPEQIQKLDRISRGHRHGNWRQRRKASLPLLG